MLFLTPEPIDIVYSSPFSRGVSSENRSVFPFSTFPFAIEGDIRTVSGVTDTGSRGRENVISIVFESKGIFRSSSGKFAPLTAKTHGMLEDSMGVPRENGCHREANMMPARMTNPNEKATIFPMKVSRRKSDIWRFKETPKL